MADKNFLLGKGERLTADVVVRGGGGPKSTPYTFGEAKKRLAPMLKQAIEDVDGLPDDAFPDDQAIVSLTLNPEYTAKSYFPTALLQDVGIEVVGSRPRKLTPEKRSKERIPVEAMTTELFARGTRAALRSWGSAIEGWTEDRRSASELASIELISAPKPREKIKGELPGVGRSVLEVVLHADGMEGESTAIANFQKYLQARGIEVEYGKKFYAKGLCFLEIVAPVADLEAIASFSIVRALRKMPELRVLRPIIRSPGLPSSPPELPIEGPISTNVSIAIFDGGIPNGHPITTWVNTFEFPGMKPAIPSHLEHGVAVSSAALFGHLDTRRPVPRPFASVDHYRVLDDDPSVDPFELYEVLERIESVISSRNYDFVSLSLGPRMPIEDDDVHAWTAVLDDRLSRSSTLAAIAVGNDGEGDSITGLNRIQVPADCVNAMAIGACDTPEEGWSRASYSSIGPGRSPGLMKPDLVSFGGAMDRPFLVLGPELNLSVVGTGGTSFATPSVIRMASGVRAHFGENLDHLAIRSLLIHTAEQSEHNAREIGWGRAARNLDDIVLCNDDEVRVVYQGEISPSKYIRASIPLPVSELPGMVELKATVVYKSQTDPHHPGNYTRAGLEVTFRPRSDRFTRDGQVHPDSKPFFGSRQAGSDETTLRRDAMKWENCLHAKKRMRGSSLSNPVFDVHYNSRIEGRNYASAPSLPYALVVSVKAKGVADLYNQIVRTYASQLEPLRPVLEIPVRT